MIMCILESPSGWDIGGLPKDIFPIKTTIDDMVDAILDLYIL